MQLKDELQPMEVPPEVETMDTDMKKGGDAPNAMAIGERDIWDLTSPELVCLAAINPKAVIRHLQDLGKELDLKISSQHQTGQ